MNKHFARETIDFFFLPFKVLGYVMAWIKGFYDLGAASAVSHAIWLYRPETDVKPAQTNSDLIAKLREIYPNANITQVGDTIKVDDAKSKDAVDKSKLH